MNGVVSIKPSRKYVDFTFWLTHLTTGALLYLIYNEPLNWGMEKLLTMAIALFGTGLFFFVLYCLAIASFAKERQGSAAVWGLIAAFFFPPIGMWGTYALSFASYPVAPDDAKAD